MSSKATTALQRLKEIDKKYKSRLSDHNKIVRETSSDGSDEKSREILRPRLNIQMPETYVEYLNNYPSDNERKLLSPIRVVNSLLESADVYHSYSKELEGSSVIVLKEKDNPNSEEEIPEQSISEILQGSNETYDEHSQLFKEGNGGQSVELERSLSKEKILNFSEFLDNYSNAVGGLNDSSSNRIEILESKAEKLTSCESVESHDEEAIGSYSQDPFESNASACEENESEEETIASETSDYLTPDVEIYQDDSQVVETIANNSMTIVNDREGKLSSQNSETNSKENKLREANEIIKIKSGIGVQSLNVDIPLQNIGFNSQRDVGLMQSANVIAHGEFEARCEDKKIHVTDELSESNTCKLSTELEKLISSIDEAGLAVAKKMNESVVGLHRQTTVEEKGQNKLKNHKIRRERRQISSSIKQYVRRLDEENSHLRLFSDRLEFPDNSFLRVIKPLQFPKIPEFIRLGGHQDHDPDIAFLRSRLTDIRQWLKDQYLLYKEHYNLAASINRNYQPADVAYTKKGIHQSRRKKRNEVEGSPDQ
ncbi:uncharacterized protein LOC107041635 isoform X1 [Diachasma alloeum]|uniref:uncharacterized protein LOC107041635 isoform X1 n=1 Tax=Diachasma alloeum TaxID=454923 RepID=UPI000738268F|nr:uncharacterized protein LOC107041635 isoform X1 [Diachasma alloeum]